MQSGIALSIMVVIAIVLGWLVACYGRCRS
jgi:cytochrome bd-type quinol oxidase subunit 1